MATAVTAGISLGRQTWTFIEHFLEMCVSMCVVGTPLVLLFFVWGPSAIGYSDPRSQFPELSLLVIACFYTAPMVAWMRYRGMEWRPTLEMGGVTLGVAVVLIGLAWLGILSTPSLKEFASPAFCGPACAVMVLAMLPRLDLYTGRSGHHMGHGLHGM
jgi:hypothetical protein